MSVTSSSVSLNDWYRPVSYTIHNKSAKELNDSLRLVVGSSGFYRSQAVHVGAIAPFGKKVVRAELQRVGGVTIDDLQDTAYRLLMDIEDETLEFKSHTNWPNMFFYKDAKNEWDKGFNQAGCNILVFGVAGKLIQAVTVVMDILPS